MMVPTAVNGSTQVIGYGALANGNQHAFLFANGVLTDLGTLGQQQSWALGLNDAGTLVGNAGASSVTTTFISTNGNTTALPGTFTEVAGINNSGLIAGASLASSQPHATVYNGTSFTVLETSAFRSWATAINSAGDIAGRMYATSGGPLQGFIYSCGTLTNLGTLGGAGTTVYGMNDTGQIVGNSQTSGSDWHAFLYSGGALVDLGTSGTAYDINNAGQVVGGESTMPGSAFLYSAGNTIWLDTVADYGDTNFVSLDEARAINDLGQIAGFGTTANGEVHAFILSPISLTPVPEPSTWGAIAAGSLGALALVRKLRRRRERPRVPAVA